MNLKGSTIWNVATWSQIRKQKRTIRRLFKVLSTWLVDCVRNDSSDFKDEASLCNILRRLCSHTDVGRRLLPDSWAIMSRLCLTLTTFKIQTWFPELVHSFWPAAQMLRVSRDLCFWTPTLSTSLVLCHWLCCNIRGKQTLKHPQWLVRIKEHHRSCSGLWNQFLHSFPKIKKTRN